MRTLSIYYTHKPGGFCKRLYRLLNALSNRGHEVHYLTLDDPKDRISQSVNIHLIPFPLNSRSGLFFWFLFLLWAPVYLAWKARKIKPERYVVFGAFYSALTLITKITHQAPVIFFFRSLVFKVDEITGKPVSIRFISTLVDKTGIFLASKIVVMSNTMRAELTRFLGQELQNISILPNDLPKLDFIRIQSSEKGSTVNLITSGVLDERKNVRLILEALSALKTELGEEKFSLTVCGDGPLLNSLKNYAQSNELTKVEFPGWVNDLTPYLKSSDLLIHPALHEGVSNSVLEALSVKLPVILSDIPEHRELLPVNEILFSPESAESLSFKLKNFLQNPLPFSVLTEPFVTKLSFDWDARAAEIVTERQ